VKKFNWQLALSISLVLASALLYLMHFLIFRDPHHVWIYLVGDIAFVPIEVLLVTIILHRLLSVHEKRSMLKKLNMVIGAFFSEVGCDLLRSFAEAGIRNSEQGSKLQVDGKWTSKDFKREAAQIMKGGPKLDGTQLELVALRDALVAKRQFLLGLLENPNLLEHDAFTDLLWAVFHLTEELECRPSLEGLSDNDRIHLVGDAQRVVDHLVAQWLDYMRHLKSDYPYLFSLAVRTNPFNPEASPVVV